MAKGTGCGARCCLHTVGTRAKPGGLPRPEARGPRGGRRGPGTKACRPARRAGQRVHAAGAVHRAGSCHPPVPRKLPGKPRSQPRTFSSRGPTLEAVPWTSPGNGAPGCSHGKKEAVMPLPRKNRWTVAFPVTCLFVSTPVLATSPNPPGETSVVGRGDSGRSPGKTRRLNRAPSPGPSSRQTWAGWHGSRMAPPTGRRKGAVPRRAGPQLSFPKPVRRSAAR